MAQHKCLVCGKPITYTFAICSSCEAQYGKSAKSWPSWLRFLWADTQRERRQEKKYNSMVDFSIVVGDDGIEPAP